jgi:hypothetical protein
MMNLVISEKLYEMYCVINGARRVALCKWYEVQREDNVITVTGEHEGLGMLGGR